MLKKLGEMKKFLLMLSILVCVLMVQAEVLTPIHWSSERVGDSVRLTAVIDSGWHMTLFAVNGEDVSEMTEYEGTYTMTLFAAEDLSVRYNACNDNMCLAPEVYKVDAQLSTLNSQPSSLNSQPSSLNSQPSSLWWIFLMGLLGGLLAIFTPCVWPIIPMTVSFFLKRTDNGIRHAIIYGLSIIVIYVGLGLLITVLFGASALNDLATNAVVNLVFFAILVVFALSFFGLFELTLPASWSTRLDARARETGGLMSIFLMAFTLVIVSFSCTGPIIGTLLVEAAGGGLLAPMIGMLGFAIALALPFSLFAMFPQWMKQMPKSGGWMQSLKVVLAFIELALSLKFFSVADMAYGWGLLPRWLFLVIWIGCFAGIGVYLTWSIRQVSRVRKVIRLVVIVLSWSFAAYLVPGLWGAPVKAVSAFAPPAPITNTDVFDDYDAGMQYARQTDKQVLLHFTGYGCVNCRKMEVYVMEDERVKAALNDYVQITLYVDDKRDNIGERNSRLQREQFGSNAQPYYVKLNPDGQQIGEAMAFTTDPDVFLQWLAINN